MLDVTKLKEKLLKVTTDIWKDKLESKVDFLKSYLIIICKKLGILILIFSTVYTGCSLTGHFLNKKPISNTTKYSAVIQDKIVYCNVTQREKGCYNLLECEDENTYFCVQNIKMYVDK